MSSSSSSSKICFNPDCKETKSEQWRKGWRLRSGEISELCDRCGAAFEEAKFCEVFHADAAGWRKCETCGKRIHCGCIVSVHTFLLLDMGGVECMPCAKKNFYMTRNASLVHFLGTEASNQMWPSSLFLPVALPERLKDLSVKNWNHVSGPTSMTGQWRPTPNMWNNATAHSELHPRVPYEFDRPNSVDLASRDRVSASSQDRKKIEDESDRIQIGNLDGIANDTRKTMVTEASLTNCAPGTPFETRQSSCANVSLPPSAPKDESSTPIFGVSVSFSSSNGTNDLDRTSGALQPHLTAPASKSKQFYGGSNSGMEASGEPLSQIRNGRLRAEARGRNQLLPRYHPRITDQELQQISGDSNSIITPLFEKMLSASDAGRIGRLVLPKKCAEAYFPAISQPEGLPLKVQDAKGKEWQFQFRFWPNNNSRMYVLEGVTPCIQSMQLQAGDTVTFSRMDPEGKLIMGFRKASSIPSEQDAHALKNGNGTSVSGKGKPSEVPSTLPIRPSKNSADSNSNSQMTQAIPTNSADAWAKPAKGGGVPKEGAVSKGALTSKRKTSMLGSKSKRLRINNEDSMVLKLTWEEAQGLLRPPTKLPSVVVIEGHEFEEYEEPPILGRPSFFTTTESGETNQWVQCDFCSKWRKLPADAVIPTEWHCSLSSSDRERGRCETPQEITTEQLEALIAASSAPSKRKRVKEESDGPEASEGLDTLAIAAILGESGSTTPSNQPTTKHPRHRDGCSCIVCIQPPSGKGPKHKQSCTCNVCLMVKRRFRTLMLRREKRQSEKDGGTTGKKHQIKLPQKRESDGEELSNGKLNGETVNSVLPLSDGVSDDTRKETTPLKGQIDLNIQPEREEEASPLSDSASMLRLLQDAATDIYFRHSRSVNVNGNKESVVDEVEPSCSLEEEMPLDTDSKLNADRGSIPQISASILPSTPPAG